MNYYEYRPDANRYAGLTINREQLTAHPAFKHLLGSTVSWAVDIIYDWEAPLLKSWSPPVAEVFEDNPPRQGDFPSLSDFWRLPVMSARAWECLSPLMNGDCEWLPIRHPTRDDYGIVHLLRELDCLDEDRSELERYSDGPVMGIDRYAFKSDVVADHHIFRLPRKSGGELCHDEVFRQAVEANKLKGLLFKPLQVTLV